MAHGSQLGCWWLGDSDLTPWEGGVQHDVPHGEKGGTILVMIHQHLLHHPVLLQGQEFWGGGEIVWRGWEEDEEEDEEEKVEKEGGKEQPPR